MEGEFEEESVGGFDSEDDPDFVVTKTEVESEQIADEGGCLFVPSGYIRGASPSSTGGRAR
nr:unnamed protein product [Callosobruchus analis]